MVNFDWFMVELGNGLMVNGGSYEYQGKQVA